MKLTKKSNLLFLLLTFYYLNCHAQNIGINNSNPETSLDIAGAMRLRFESYEVTSSTITIPANKSHVILSGSPASPFTILIDNPSKGQLLILHNQTGQLGILGLLNLPLNVSTLTYNGNDWVPIMPMGGSSSDAWRLDGNAAISGTDHLGTTDASPLNIKTNSTQRMQIGKDGHVGIGVDADPTIKININGNDEAIGLKSSLENSATAPNGDSYGIYSVNSSKNSGIKYGGIFMSDNTNPANGGDNIGLKGYAASSANRNIAIFGSTLNNGGSDFAGFFDKGNVRIEHRLQIGGVTLAANKLTIVKPENNTEGAAYISMAANGKSNHFYVGKPTGTNNDFIGLEIDVEDTPTAQALKVLGNSTFSNTVSIGAVPDYPTPYSLAVRGAIIAEELRIQNYDLWPDYVFEKDYPLPKLSEVKSFIEQKKHLPNVPAASEVKENGIEVGEMQKILLRKVEELTLYIIEQQRQIDLLKSKLNKVK